MIEKQLLRDAFISTIKANDFTEKQIADACQLSQSRINKAISGAPGSNSKWPTEYICLATYFLAKKTKGDIPQEMEDFYSLFINNIKKAATNSYKTLNPKNYIFNGEAMNISKIANSTGLSRYIVTKKINSSDIKDGDEVKRLFD